MNRSFNVFIILTVVIFVLAAGVLAEPHEDSFS